MQIRTILFAFITLFLFGSCSVSKEINYFQDIETGIPEEILNPLPIKIKPEDKISIVVNSKNPELVALFNLPIASYRVGQTDKTTIMNNSQGISGYTVDASGDIDFPVLGKIHVAGMTREEAAAHIKHELIAANLIKDPVVTIEFMNLTISVIGEVNHPGRYGIDRDRMTLVDALSMAGDLTIFGQRENVLVLRQENGIQRAYRVNLCSDKDLRTSPVYYLQQNDVVYVEPNAMRARQSTVNGNNIRSASFWMSLTSLLTTIVVLIVK